MIPIYTKEQLRIEGKILIAGVKQYDFTNSDSKTEGIRILKKNLMMEGYSDEYFDFQKQLLSK